jgi:hypothetical protein
MQPSKPKPTLGVRLDETLVDLRGFLPSRESEPTVFEGEDRPLTDVSRRTDETIGSPAQVWHRSLAAPPLIAAQVPVLPAEMAAAVQRELDAHVQLDRPSAARLTEVLLRGAAWVCLHFDPTRTELDRATFLEWRLRKEMAGLMRELGPRAVRRAHVDQLARDRALSGGDGALLDYLDRHALVRLDQLRRNRKAWWHITGLTYDDLRETARAELAVAVLEDGLESSAEPGKEATVRFLYSLRRRLRTEARTRVWEKPSTPHLAWRAANYSTPEQELMDREETLQRADALVHAAPQLTRLQHRWIAAFRADIEQHGELSLARAAASLGRSRAAASLARKSIQAVVDQHLPRGACDEGAR